MHPPRHINPSIAGQQPNAVFRIGALVHGRTDIVHLEFGEPDFPTPAHIVEAAHRSLREDRQGYGPGNGMAPLRAAISNRATHVTHLSATPDQVVVTPGGTGALMASLLVLCTAGDEVLVPDPAWPGYEAMLAAIGAPMVRYPLRAEDGWLPDLDALEAAITARTRVLVLNTPSNPAGVVFPRSLLEGMLELARRHDLWVLSDECYDQIVFDGEHVSPAALDVDGRVLVVGTCSKSYAMTGWRVGWVVAPPAIAPSIALATAAEINNLPLFVQRAAEAALTGPQECVAAMVRAYHERRDLALTLVRQRGITVSRPSGAFYLLVPIAPNTDAGAHEHDSARLLDGVRFAEELIAAHGIAVAPGIAFGSLTRGYMRVSLATATPALTKGLEGLLAFAASYQHV